MHTQSDNSGRDRQHSPLDNELLYFLHSKSYHELAGQLTLTTMQSGETIHSVDHPMQYLYFPTTSILTKNYLMSDGSSTMVAMIGNEGLAGVTHLMGGDAPSCNLRVLRGGSAYRIRKSQIEAEFNKSVDLQNTLLLYVQAMMTQISQTLACNRHHTILQQMCRWLLLYIDRADSVDISTTHEQIALNLGVRRESVTEAAHKLHLAGIIEYLCRLISVVNRDKLENQVCECYSVVQREYTRLLLSGTTPSENHLVNTAARTQPPRQPVDTFPYPKYRKAVDEPVLNLTFYERINGDCSTAASASIRYRQICS